MGLRVDAEADLNVILEDDVFGFGFPIVVTDPAGTVGSVIGFSNDISQFIDPDTGQAVKGRIASAALRISSLTTKGLGLPTGVADATSKPWIIAFDDINGNPYTFKVIEGNPDRGLGMIVCVLELYTP